MSKADQISSFDLKKFKTPINAKCFLVCNAVFHVR